MHARLMSRSLMMPCRAIRYHTPPQGGFGLRVSTTFSLNWPLAGTARLPLAMEIELVELSGPVRLVYVDVAFPFG